ncbi:MAG TPA: TetR/AcrR family transcriptional regulator [Galbitalea sp.]|jgi:AcrR family transcriptional regulator|nr:TetR/AcrR family transcriptional regulator [Galbitalea sp.]
MDSKAVRYRPPQQDRSRRALQKVLGAAESVLVDKGFDDFTMTAVAEQADVSIGAIYRRFDGKEQLLEAVWDSLLAKMESDLAAALETAEPNLAGVVSALVRASVADLSGNKLFPYLYAPTMAQTTRVHDAISTRRKLFLAAVDSHLGEVRRQDRRVAVVMVQAMVTGSCVHRASQGRSVEDGLTWDDFAQQLEELAMAYLLQSS